ncbi:amino acid adenylation domain-containing protein [Streptomyces kaniharaensis]|uniref:Amino acid adenylation domain-containing protein n=1 Tax=Streptomyces kaniharaensis TaxID=212423 RepID=A0A6N7KTM8_9ACTN|nr:non-ribosomal peptide synthetase [Streptomyces kaniharaensis]MQS14936.1 amino acid adenylation domain-containing protein [Streptomyces kaniharaensis]
MTTHAVPTAPTEADRREQLRALLKARAARGPQSHPVAEGQQALWTFQQMYPHSPAYNVGVAARVLGDLDVPALRTALQRLLDTHPAMRTALVAEDGQLRQRVRTTVPLDFTEVDLTGRTPAEIDAAVAAFNDRPFDFAQDAMLRAAVARLDGGTHLLMLCAHHVASDLWTFDVLMRDLEQHYRAVRAGRPAGAARPETEYLDFVRWQREWLASPAGRAAERYWLDRLDGDLQPLDLPLDRPRPATPAHRAGAHTFRLGEKLTAALKDLARECGATPYSASLAVFQLLMHRYTGQRDVLVGSVASGRSRAAFQQVAGYFANPLVIRAEVRGEQSFRELVGQTRTTVLDGLQYGDYPFPLLARRLAERRPGSPSGLYNVTFYYESASWDAQDGLSLFGTGHADAQMRFADLTLRPYPLAVQGNEHDLTLFVEEVDGSLCGSLRYATDLFDAATAARIAEHFVSCAEACVARPDAAMGTLPLLTADEERQLASWSRPDDGVATADSLVHELILAQAERTPDAVAVDAGQDRLTYRELVERAHRLAAVLRGHGIGPEDKVGLSVDGSVRLVTGMLGVLLAGGAYIPMDPNYPVKRLEYMMEDSAVRLLLTERHLLGRLPHEGVPVLCLDEDHPLPDPLPEPAAPRADNLAYVIYTSGSTGRPKGVMVEHGGLVDLDLAHREALPPQAGRRVLQNASISFDVSTWEWMSALCTGATLCLAPREELRPGQPLVDTVRRLGVTALSATPSVLATMDPAEVPSITELTSVGEAISADLVRSWSPGRRIVNAYGPTEITVFCTTETLVADGRTPPVGRAVAGTELYVLDEQLQQVPIGAVGELYVGGTGVTRGYQNRPDLTADRFVPHPFSAEPGSRLYRTGDRVRFDTEGRLHYLGRSDHQVKIRGVRVEPGEVLEALAGHPAVREAVVLARPVRGELQLVGYVVPEAGVVAPDAAELRTYLAQRLMPTMIPTFLVVLEKFPLNPNGKVDRALLPDPEQIDLPASSAPPAGPTEQAIADIWSAVLGLPSVGRDDDFFDLGGHSLLATKVVGRVREALAVDLPLRELFEGRTVRALAERVDALTGSGGAVDAPITRLARAGSGLPLSFAQQRLWFMEQLRPGDQAYRIAGELRLTGPVDAALLDRALAEVIQRHEVLRTVYRAVDGEPRQIVARTPAEPLPLIDLTNSVAMTVEEARVAHTEAFDTTPFDLTRSPLRARLLRLAEDRHVLLLALHHIASDGWSMRVLLRELTEVYRAFAKGEDSPLTGPEVQYADFASWQRERQETGQGAAALAYWEQRLAGSPPALDLPADRPRTRPGGSAAGSTATRLDPDLVRSLERVASGAQASLSMVLLSAFNVVLSRWSGQQDVLVGMPVAGRLRTDLENTVGLFVNTVVVRTDNAPGQSFRDLLGAVRQSTLDADAHQETPFERIVERIAPVRDLTRTPLFQVVFNMQNLDAFTAEIPGVDVQLVEAEDVNARFELTLYAVPRDGRVDLRLVYDAGLYLPDTVRAMLAQLVHVLEQVAADPTAVVGELSLAGGEPAQDPALPLPPAPWRSAVHERFLAAAQHTPHAPALSLPGGASLSYAELASWTGRLAERLRGHGIGAGDRVVIDAERTPGLVAAVIAVLRTGAAFCVLDRAHPLERREHCARLLRPTAWLDATTAPAADGPQLPGVRCTLRAEDERHTEGTGGRDLPAAPDQLAYAAFTSGSTGTPKAVLGPHAPLAHFVDWYTETFDVGADDRFALTAGLSHDPLLRDIFVPLSLGAVLHVPEPARLAAPESLAAELTGAGVTVWHLTPPTARFLSGLPAGALPTLRHAFFGGDVLTGHESGILRALAPGATLVNFYGATETPQAPAFHVLTDEDTQGPIPLGTGIDRTQLLVLRDGRPAGVGELGEIAVRGPYLAEGYADDPQATAERFLPSGAAGERAYRTGDLGRLRADGTVAFAGRADRQVKVRGYRVEPQEIEAALRAEPEVREALVDAVTDGSGETVLTGYVVTSTPVGPIELRARLAGRLPAHLVPASVVAVDAFPLTANRKVDLAALRRLGQAARPAAAGPTPADGPEARIAELWRRLLGVEHVGREENFFDLGGHSLMMVRLHTLLRDELGHDVPVVDLFRYPTVAALAAHLRGPAADDNRPAAAPAAANTNHLRAARRRRLNKERNGG